MARRQAIAVVVGCAPGGRTDLMAMAHKRLPCVLKQLGNTAQFVVENRPGVGGGIAAAAVKPPSPLATRSQS